MTKLFLSDLDGTLMDEYGTIQREDREALKQLEEQHIAFGMVTGRDYGFCQRLRERYQLQECDIIANNGASVWMDGEKIVEEVIDAEEAIEIMEYLKDYVNELNPFICDEQHHFYFLKNYYENEQWVKVSDLLSYLGEFSEMDLLDFLYKYKKPAVKISIHTFSQAQTDKWLPRLRERFPDRYEILPTSVDYIEITRKGVNKGKAVAMIMDRLNLNPEDIAVIGDGENDISMFRKAPLSFAMSHANEEVKQAAAHVVKSVAEAVAFVIKYSTDPSGNEREDCYGKEKHRRSIIGAHGHERLD